MPGLSFYDKQHIQKIAAQQAVIANIFNRKVGHTLLLRLEKRTCGHKDTHQRHTELREALPSHD